MKYYYAIFNHSKNTVEVEFPDLNGCVTFGSNRDEALDNATDVLAAWLANAESRFIKEPSSYIELKKKYPNSDLIPIAIDEQLLESYEALKRFNVIFPAKLLNKVDNYRKKMGLKRSTLLMIATEEYLKKQKSSSIKS
ncbi:MAG: type II toxin-antitoxin system HicB family antitoxin [Ignavibacteria bacterium]|jgi:predicted RNase H-like HicB family nuclease